MLDKLPEDLREKIIETSFYKEVIFWTSSFTDFITKLHEYIKWVDISLYLYIWTIVFILLFVKNNSNEKVTKKDKNIKVTNLDIDKKLYNPNLIEFLKEKGFIVFIYLKTLIFLIKNIIKEKNYRISFLNSLSNSYLKEKELKFKTNLFIDF